MTTRKDLEAYPNNKYGKCYRHANGMVIERFYHSWDGRVWWKAGDGSRFSKMAYFKRTLKDLLAAMDESDS